MNATGSDLERVHKFFDTIVFGFIYHDLDAAVCGQANYLAALGLVAYTEFMGGLVTGTLGHAGRSRKRFSEFLKRMGRDYERRSQYIYEIARNGLVHQYFIAETSIVKMTISRGIGLQCGVEEHDGKTYFVVEKYIRDFKAACEQYCRELEEACRSSAYKALLRNFKSALGGKWFEREVTS